MKKTAILLGPFVGELYWEAGRFAPMLPYMIRNGNKNKDVTYIVLTREERFDLYGKFADILVPLRVPGDYGRRQPNCFRLNGLKPDEYSKIAEDFHAKYRDRFQIIKHVYPDVRKGKFVNKNQFPSNNMRYEFQPRQANYDIVNSYLPKDGKPLVVLAPRFRKGFRRNWNHWPDFYNKIIMDKTLTKDFNFIICGKQGEYIPDAKKRFLDLNDMQINEGASLVGLLLVVMENAFFTFGSQSAIPNISLLYNTDVLEFGCQRKLHTKIYNVKNTPITFLDDRQYNIAPKVIFPQFKRLLYKKKEKTKCNKPKMLGYKQKR